MEDGFNKHGFYKMSRKANIDFNFQSLQAHVLEQYAQQILAPTLFGGQVDGAMGWALVNDKEHCRVPFGDLHERPIDLTGTTVFRSWCKKMTDMGVYKVNLGFIRKESGAVQHVIDLYLTEDAYRRRDIVRQPRFSFNKLLNLFPSRR